MQLTCSYFFAYEFYVTKLKGLYLTILEYNWLSQYNSLIDWIKETLKPYAAKIESAPDPKKVIIAPYYDKTQDQKPKQPLIIFINTVVY